MSEQLSGRARRVTALVLGVGFVASFACRSTPGAIPERDVPYGAPGAAQAMAVAQRLPLDLRVDTRALYRRAEREVARMPRYSSSAGRQFGPRSRRETELDGRWEDLGPSEIGGRTRTLVIDPRRGTLYAGGVSGGVWKRKRNAKRWTEVGDELQNVAVNSMAMDPRDSDTIVVGTGEGYFREDVRGTGLPLRGGGIFRTTTGARRWELLASTSGEDFWFVNDLVYSADGGRLYAATRTGVFRTDDDGVSWSRILDPDVQGGCLDLAIRTDRPADVLFAACGTFEQARVWRATDARDDSAGWEAVLADPGMGRTAIAIAPANQDVIYALAASIRNGRFDGALHGVFRSDTGGAAGSWEARVRNSDPALNNTLLLENPIVMASESCGFGPNGSPIPMGWYVNSLAVDPTDADTVWAAGVDWFRSDDGGANWGAASYWWNRRSASFVHADQHGMVFDPGYDGDGNQRAYVLSDGGVFRTTNARGPIAATLDSVCDVNSSGVTFEHFTRGLNITQFYHGSVAADGSLLLAGAQDNGTSQRRTADRVNYWNTVLGGDGSYSAIDRSDPNIQYYQSQSNNLIKSTTGGRSGDPARNGLPAATFEFLGPGGNFLFITPLTLFADAPERGTESLLTGGRQVFLSDDRAESWRAVSGNLPKKGRVSAIASAPGNGNAVLVGTDRGHLLFTDRLGSMSSGSRWPSKRPRKAWVTSVAFDPTPTLADPKSETLYATYGGFGGRHVYRSVDSDGRSWKSIDGNLPDIPVHSIVVDPANGNRLFIGTDLGVFVTTDGGENWAQEIAGFGNIVTEWLVLQREGAKLMLYAFTHGRGAWRVEVAR